jgi:hypothetical protein
MEARSTTSLKEMAKAFSEMLRSDQPGHDPLPLIPEQLIRNPGLAGRYGHEDRQDPREHPADVGIWQLRTENGAMVYERDASKKEEWSSWANIHRIVKKKSGRRVVLLGESVARGYFYDPYYNVAIELEGILKKVNDFQDAEVVDLARTSMTFEILLEMIDTCGALEPDIVVIFAGNNWLPRLMASVKEGDAAEIGEAFFADSYPGIQSFLERQFESILISLLSHIGKTLVSGTTKVIFVIPPYNLKDWKSDRNGKGVPWLPEQDLMRWLAAKDQAEAALQVMDFESLLLHASTMTQTDYHNPYGHELLAEYHIRSRNWDQAKRSLEIARDVVIVNRGGNTHPKCFGVIRDVINRCAGEYGITVVDAPAIFDESTKDSVPDRDLFLDYCHLTVKAIKICMRFTAKAILGLYVKGSVPIESIPESAIQPENEHLAFAHFWAAIHNAHYEQSHEVVMHHCTEAIHRYLGVKDVMLSFVDYASRRAPTLLCRSYGKSLVEGRMKQYEGGFHLRAPRNKKIMDTMLIDVITRCLLEEGVDVYREVKKLREKEHLVDNERVDLLESYYSRISYLKNSPEDFDAEYIQTRGEVTEFNFICRAGQRLDFRIVYRTRNGANDLQKVKVTVNGKGNIAILLPMSVNWTAASFTCKAEWVREDLNTLVIHWPILATELKPFDRDTDIQHFFNELLPVRGDIHLLTVAGATEN